jgi:hypothetical protein
MTETQNGRMLFIICRDTTHESTGSIFKMKFYSDFEGIFQGVMQSPLIERRTFKLKLVSRKNFAHPGTSTITDILTKIVSTEYSNVNGYRKCLS